MDRKTILLLHGFASSGQSTKAQYFREKFKALPQVEFHTIDFNPTPRDFEYMTVTGMINRLRQYVLDHRLENISLSPFPRQFPSSSSMAETMMLCR